MRGAASLPAFSQPVQWNLGVSVRRSSAMRRRLCSAVLSSLTPTSIITRLDFLSCTPIYIDDAVQLTPPLPPRPCQYQAEQKNWLFHFDQSVTQHRQTSDRAAKTTRKDITSSVSKLCNGMALVGTRLELAWCRHWMCNGLCTTWGLMTQLRVAVQRDGLPRRCTGCASRLRCCSQQSAWQGSCSQHSIEGTYLLIAICIVDVELFDAGLRTREATSPTPSTRQPSP